jgi:hypothetical protein
MIILFIIASRHDILVLAVTAFQHSIAALAMGCMWCEKLLGVCVLLLLV